MSIRVGSGQWQPAQSPMLVTVRGRRELRASIVDVYWNTPVDVMVSVRYSEQAPIDLAGSTRTRDITLPRAKGRVYFVGPDGSGIEYTRDKPGALRPLLSSGVPCDSRVILLDGRYDNAYDMELKITSDCSAEKPIVIEAESYRKVVFSGDTTLSDKWQRTPNDPDEWFRTLPSNLAYTSLAFGSSGHRLYPYALRTPNNLLPGYPSLKDLGYDLPGFYRSGSQIFVRDTTTDLSPVPLTVSKRWSCLRITGNGKRAHLVVAGIIFESFGNTICTPNILGVPDVCYPPFTMSFDRIRNVTVSNCVFNRSNFPITFNGECSDIRIIGNEIRDGVGTWSHGAFKQTREASVIDLGSYGRYLENAGIWFAPSDNDSITDIEIHLNDVDGTVVGISAGSNAANYLFDNIDIHGNNVTNCYDGIDITGGNGRGASNARIRNNFVGNTPVGTSLIFPTYGPISVTRNVYFLQDRKNHNNDVFFVQCDNTVTDRSWSTALKLNAGGVNSQPGPVAFQHNTVVVRGKAGFGMYLWAPTWSKLVIQNNIFQTEASPLMFDGVKGIATYPFESNGNVYHQRAGSQTSTIKPVHGIVGCSTVVGIDELRLNLRSITESPNVLIGSSDLAVDPMLTDLANGSVSLAPESPVIDKAIPLPGINSVFEGAGPDPGAVESPGITSVEGADEPLTGFETNEYYTVLGTRLNSEPTSSGLYFKVVRLANGKIRLLPGFIIR